MYGDFDPWLLRLAAKDRTEGEEPLDPLSEPEVQPEDIRFALIAGLIAGVVILGCLTVSALSGP
ncbi:MAG: hypothetical protein ACK4GT_10415 [Pararhodobacter sp.]